MSVIDKNTTFWGYRRENGRNILHVDFPEE